jgi:hypothetical protein
MSSVLGTAEYFMAAAGSKSRADLVCPDSRKDLYPLGLSFTKPEHDIKSEGASTFRGGEDMGTYKPKGYKSFLESGHTKSALDFMNESISDFHSSKGTGNKYNGFGPATFPSSKIRSNRKVGAFC